MGSLGEMMGAAFDSVLKREHTLTKIRTWLEDNDHMLPDGGEALWEILDEEADGKPCNCGFGGFHDDGNLRCDRNGA